MEVLKIDQLVVNSKSSSLLPLTSNTSPSTTDCIKLSQQFYRRRDCVWVKSGWLPTAKSFVCDHGNATCYREFTRVLWYSYEFTVGLKISHIFNVKHDLLPIEFRYNRDWCKSHKLHCTRIVLSNIFWASQQYLSWEIFGYVSCQ